MQRVIASLVLICALAALTVGFAGCGSRPTDSTSSSPAEPSTTDDNHSEQTHGDHASDGQSAMEKMEAELAKLSSEDAASAEKQHFCPVSGEMLGTMGPPKKIEVKGQQVWICCEHCEEALLANPDEDLAKLHRD